MRKKKSTKKTWLNNNASHKSMRKKVHDYTCDTVAIVCVRDNRPDLFTLTKDNLISHSQTDKYTVQFSLKT